MERLVLPFLNFAVFLLFLLLLFGVTALNFPFIGKYGFIYEFARGASPYLIVLWLLVILIASFRFFRGKEKPRSLFIALISLGCVIHLIIPLDKHYLPYGENFFDDISDRYELSKRYKVLLAYENGEAVDRVLKNDDFIASVFVGSQESLGSFSCSETVELPDGEIFTVGYNPPCEALSVISLGSDLPPLIKIDLRLEEQEFPLFIFRALSFKGEESHYKNHLAVRRYTTLSRHTERFIALNSFQRNPWSGYYWRFYHGSKSLDSDWGRGARICSGDYLFVKGKLFPEKIRKLEGDVKGIVAEFSLIR